MEERKEGFFSRLGKLFSSNLVVVNVGGKKLKIMDTDMMQSFNKTATNILYDKFNRLYRSPSMAGSNNFMGNFPYLQQRLSLFNDYEMMDCDPTIATALDIFSDECLAGETIIPTPDNKNLSIEELSKLYPNEDTKFYVYSYDIKSKSIKLGTAHSVKKTKTEMTYKIIFDDKKYIIATDNHPFLMKNGNYKQVKDLQLNDIVMSFYQKDFLERQHMLFDERQIEHKIIVIEPYKIIDVYDMTVDEYHNFATDSCFVHNCSTKNEYGDILTIKSNDENIKKILHNLFYDVLNIQFNLWPWTRNMLKYGDTFLKLDITEKFGVVNVVPMSPYEVTREEGFDPQNPFEVRFRQEGAYGAFAFKNYEVAHFRLLSDVNFAPYGKCISQDSFVDTESGREYIKNLQIGEKIWSYNIKTNKLELATVTAKMNSGKKKILRIETQKNYVDCSENHPILTYNNITNKTEYKLAENIKIDDLLLVRIYENDLNKEISYECVKKITTMGDEITYDIQIDLENSNFFANGIVVHNSIIEPARKLWKMLTLMEDAMLIHRIMRAPERRIFYIDVGNIAPNEVESYMNTMINSMKKTPFVDQRTGDYNLRFNIMNMLEDYYMPVRGTSSNTKIETLPGMTFNGMEDIEYLRKRLLSAIRMPNPFLGYEESVEGKSTLAALDVRFGRTIERIQHALQSELVKIAIIHLYSQGYTDDKLVDFELSLTQPSTIYEAEKINLWSEKIRVAKDFFDSKLFSDDWIYQNIFNLSDDEIAKEKAKVIEGQKLLFRKTQIENEGNDPLVSGESFGTPHDIAAMNLTYGKKQTPIDFGESEFNPNPMAPRPGGLWSSNPYSMQPIYQNPKDAGRPVEPSRYGTDSHPAGRNPLGHTDLSNTLDRDRSIVHKFAHNSPLREMERDKLKTKILFENNEIDKINNSKLNELNENNGDYLDEKNIIPDETFE